ncbi:MAG TPA: hypothetical protein VJJ21_02565 [Candidatus Nanoarchaeia archaeon]|nr:hypothetical protein [Candidatus Nanoarchaeia archaeon]
MIIIVALLIGAMAFNANGFGITSDYWEGQPLNIAPGESREISLGLQNMVGDEDVDLKAFITNGSEIASLIDNPVYNVPAKSESVKLRLKIIIPGDAAVGSKYTILVQLNQIGVGEREGQEMVQLSTGVGTKIPVVVNAIAGSEQLAEEEKPLAEEVQEKGWSTSSIVVTLAIIVLLILVGYAVLKKSKKSKK